MPRSDFHPGSRRPVAAASLVLSRKEVRTAMAIVAHTHPFVIGVDTHARNHSFTILTAATGEQIAAKQFPTTPAGLNRAVRSEERRVGKECRCRGGAEAEGKRRVQQKKRERETT